MQQIKCIVKMSQQNHYLKATK